MLPFAIVASVLQKRVRVPNWPFCAKCGRLRVRRVFSGIGLMLLGFVGVVGFSVALPPESSATAVVVIFCLLVLFTGLVIAGMTGWATVASAYVSMDGTTLHVRRPHPRFAEKTATTCERLVASRQNPVSQ
ncbi:hypothetical protein [Micromonospora sp. IBSANI012]|uniref:hypothetical protein n=1 Tax=Micromonospora sp. IBSANI012 TaxID=3457761 RepID=UPI004059AB69